MSIELLLVPVVIAVATQIMDRQKTSDVRVPSRMRDEELLRSALTAYGCTEIRRDASGSLGAEQGISFVNENGDYVAHFPPGTSEAQAEEYVRGVEVEYMRQVQTQSYQRLRDLAQENGLTLETETVAEDGTVVMNFLVVG